VSTPNEPTHDEILQALQRAVQDIPRLREFTIEEMARQLILGGYLREEPPIDRVEDAFGTLIAEEQAFGPEMWPEDIAPGEPK
jgi:hypothetical protein